jgi:hypothetical protein
MKKITKKFLKDDASQFQDFLCEFPQISRTVLYKIITIRLGYHKFCTRWVPKMLTGVHKTQRMASVFSDFFLEQYHKYGDEFLNHIVTGCILLLISNISKLARLATLILF